MQGLETLPPWAQVAMSIGVFLVAAWAYLRGLFKTAPPPAKDVVVPSLTIADNAVIKEATATLREANRLSEAHRAHDADIYHTLVAIKDSHGRIESLLGRMLDRLPH